MATRDADDLAEDEVLQRTQDGYEKTKVKDVPLSEAAGEARADKTRRRA